MGFVVDKVALGQVFLSVLQFCCITPAMLHTYSFIINTTLYSQLPLNNTLKNRYPLSLQIIAHNSQLSGKYPHRA